MATAYLEPSLNRALLADAKSRLSAGVSERAIAGASVERVLKVFHHFESNTDVHSSWSSNIRYGDATDVRVSSRTHALMHALMHATTHWEFSNKRTRWEGKCN